MKEYFKFHLDYNPRYWKFYTSIPKEIYEWCECFFSRGAKGFCYKDVWSIDGYLCEIIPPMIQELKKTTHGYPAGLETSAEDGIENWNKILDKISDGFIASRRLMDSENWVLNEGHREIVDKNGKITFVNSWTDEQRKHFKELDTKDKETFDEGMKLFTEHFFSLWD